MLSNHDTSADVSVAEGAAATNHSRLHQPGCCPQGRRASSHGKQVCHGTECSLPCIRQRRRRFRSSRVSARVATPSRFRRISGNRPHKQTIHEKYVLALPSLSAAYSFRSLDSEPCMVANARPIVMHVFQTFARADALQGCGCGRGGCHSAIRDMATPCDQAQEAIETQRNVWYVCDNAGWSCTNAGWESGR